MVVFLCDGMGMFVQGVMVDLLIYFGMKVGW